MQKTMLQKAQHLSIVHFAILGAAVLGTLLLWPGLIGNFFATQGYDPHGQCFLWEPRLVSLYVGSDSLIGLSYVAISATLAYFAYKVRRDIPFNWVFLAFGAFIIACGTTHFMDVLTIWIPVYWSSGYFRLITAVASVATALALPPVLPRIFRFMEVARLSEARKRDLEASNLQLEKEIGQRQMAEQALKDSFNDLDHRVQERTAELANAMEALQRSEGRFRNLVQTVPGAIVVVDAVGRIVLTNERVDTLFGYTREELAGQSVEILLPQRFSQIHIAHRDAYLTHPSPRPMGQGRDLSGRRKDGTEFPVEVGLSYTETDDGMIALAFITDITERKLAEKTILEALERERAARAEAEAVEQRLTFLLEASTLVAQSSDYLSRLQQLAGLTVPRIADWCAVEVLAEDGTLQRVAVEHQDPAKVQLAFELQRRYPPDRNAGQNAYEVLRTGQPVLYPDITEAQLTASARDEEHLALIHQVGIKSGLVMPLVAHERALGVLTLVMSESGRHFGQDDLALVEDLARRAALLIENARLYEETQRLNADLEKRVVERTAQLEAANKELEAFSYSVSHDLRAPLRAIDGFSRMLIRDHDAALPAEGKRLLNVVRDNAQKMGRLIDNLLSFSRLGRQPLNLQMLSTVSLVRQVQDELSTELENRQVEMIVADLPDCRADRALLKQVYANLLGNALKFTRQRDVARIEVGYQQVDGLPTYFVRDNGAGFDMDYYDKLFGVFQRLHSVDEFEGTGVGLATVQRIIHRHGGRIWADGVVGQGATFYFTLEGKETLT